MVAENCYKDTKGIWYHVKNNDLKRKMHHGAIMILESLVIKELLIEVGALEEG
jgi:hypothetical protein